jgi:transcriptional regulator with XRE-family HTH domain
MCSIVIIMSTSNKPDQSTLTAIAAGNIRMAKALQRLTIRELAENAGMSASSLSRISAGETDINLSQLDRIASALGVDPKSLLEAGDDARR